VTLSSKEGKKKKKKIKKIKKIKNNQRIESTIEP
jgi:hypothetical protein